MLKQQSFETMKRNGFLDPTGFELRAVNRDGIGDLVESITAPLDFSLNQMQGLVGGLEECMLAYKTA